MILQALADYYRRKQADPDPAQRLPAYGFEEKEIPFILEIDGEGRLVQILDTRSGDGKKKTAQRFLVPKAVKKTSGVAANLLWDTAEYVLGIDTRGKPERVAEQHAAFRARIEALPDVAKADAGVAAVLKFLERIDFDALAKHPAWEEIKTTNPLLTFRRHGDVELVCQRPAVTEAAGRQSDEKSDGFCLVSGESDVIERLHPPIKGIWDKPGAIANKNIVGINNKSEGKSNSGQTPAFASYGKQQGYNSPVGKAAAFAYTTALNHLLAKGSRQRIQVGDASTVFWAEEPHELEASLADLFGESPKDDPDRGTDALRALYRAVESGRFAVGSDDTRFYVLGLAPNAARIAVRFWDTAPAIELARRIQRHFDDLAVARSPRDPEHLSLFRLLAATAVQGKADNIPPNLGGEVMRAILEGLPYPATLLNAAVQRCRAEQQVSYPRAAAIKAWLNRDARRRHLPKEEFSPMLDPDHPNAAYRLGRLFAVLEKIQEEASPGLNATIRDRYYGAASSTPVAVFTTLLRLKNHHLGKLHAGRATQMEKLIGEIMAGVDDFPRHLNLPDQGRFALGYYHQRQAFFTKHAAESIETASTQGEPA
ncbi:type I-C CRISPR-associated protein Cas8c/Csd1 [Extensimonas sp. H3M7-6]|uniref:type I-C CRISPR-associated protein Cas8c/Csd1 n=1 Tax=Extensimonas soli TaxID=3031322 RepID=UPI0023D9D348|nr:type I-C CRISPR-associated protein Cas8c/Csd1 [Extensimonas sp. H3M7-6]MDF1481832.1 type I-C CRISPR-associated protein Cas8c/Csd1 [Extensimonas sp. H3M7-6]